MGYLKQSYLIFLFIMLAACGGGGSNSRASFLGPLDVNAKSLYDGSTKHSMLDEKQIQTVLEDYFFSSYIMDIFSVEASGWNNVINGPSASEIEPCTNGGSQTATLYRKSGRTFIRTSFKNCKEDAILINGDVEYEFFSKAQNGFNLKTTFFKYSIGSLEINGNMLVSLSPDKSSLTNVVFSNNGKQIFLQDMYLPKPSFMESNNDSTVDQPKGRIYYTDKGYLEVQSGKLLRFPNSSNGLTSIIPSRSSPINITGLNTTTARVTVIPHPDTGLFEVENPTLSIILNKPSNDRPFYFKTTAFNFFNLDFSNNRHQKPIAKPLSIPEFSDNDLYLINGYIAIDARGSTDPDNDFLAYQWELIKTPAYSQNPLLKDTNKAVAQLYPDGFGTYIIGLKAFDGENWSEQKQFNPYLWFRYRGMENVGQPS